MDQGSVLSGNENATVILRPSPNECRSHSCRKGVKILGSVLVSCHIFVIRFSLLELLSVIKALKKTGVERPEGNGRRSASQERLNGYMKRPYFSELL